MTIAAGFVCSDGVLLASDTLYSGDEHRQGRKFWTFAAGEAVVVVGGAGTEAALKRISMELGERLHTAMSRLEIVKAIEETLAGVDALMQLQDHEKTQLLVAISLDSRALLYENQAQRLGLSPVDYPSQCIGSGFSLGLYFARSLFREGMSMRWGQVIAAHLIKNVKTFNSGYCGGDTHLFAVPNVGPVSWTKDQAHIADLESYLGPLEKAVGMVLPDGGTQ